MSHKIITGNPKDRILDLEGFLTGENNKGALEIQSKLDNGLQAEKDALSSLDIHWLIFIVDGPQGFGGVLLADKNLPQTKLDSLLIIVNAYLVRLFPSITMLTSSQAYIEAVSKVFPFVWANNTSYAVYKF